MAGSDPERCLIVGPAWVGDMVVAQSLFITLVARDPGCVIDVIAPDWSHPLLERMPEVRRGIALPVQHGELALGKRYEAGRRCRGEAYTRAIVLPRSLKAALVPFFARVPRRTGYKGETRYGLINDMRRLDKAALPQIAQRYVALALDPDALMPPPVPYPRLRIDTDNAARLIRELDLSTDTKIAAMMPGAEYGPAKQWPLEYFAQLLERLSADGVECWLLGSEKDRADAQQIVELSGGRGRNLCGHTRLEDAIDLIARADVAITNDSGLMHVAAAVGSSLIALYGSSTPAYTPPLSDSAETLYLGLECSPCMKRVCPLGHLRCLREITPERVHEIAREILEVKSGK